MLLTGVENLLASVNHIVFKYKKQNAVEREWFCFSLSTLKSFNFLISFSFNVLHLEDFTIQEWMKMTAKQW